MPTKVTVNSGLITINDGSSFLVTLMIVILVFLFKVFLKPQMVKAAKQQANRGLSGKMEAHANPIWICQ